MDTYVVELEAIETGGFALTVPAFPGLLILGQSTEQVLERARAAIAFHAAAGQGECSRTVKIVLSSRSPGVFV